MLHRFLGPPAALDAFARAAAGTNHPIAAVPLGLVQGSIGAGDNLLRGIAVLWKPGDANAYGDPLPCVPVTGGSFRHLSSNPFSGVHGPIGLGFWKHDQELLAAVRRRIFITPD